MKITYKIAEYLANSFVFTSAKNLWTQNQKNFWLPLKKWEKLYLGIYLILKDYSQGLFPPQFEDQKAAYDGEINYFNSLPGVDANIALETDIRKPFWFGNCKYIDYFLQLCKILEKCQIYPPQKILELGAGSGWMSEFLAVMKFNAIATTISHNSIEQIENRISSIEQKKIPVTLQCYETPMESVADFLKDKNVLPVDAVFVFEALHHAYDWQQSLKSAFESLDKNGWLIICNEPNLIHTFVSYRIAKLSNTHEIGMSKSSLKKTLKNIGFRKVVCFNNHWNLLIKPHWIAAQK